MLGANLWAQTNTQVKPDFAATRAKAQAGDGDAQLKLGWMFDNGVGVRQDHSEAFKWFLKAAEQGLPVAQHNVGAMYASGEGVERNREEAAKWYRKAADQGYALSQKYLAQMSAPRPPLESQASVPKRVVQTNGTASVLRNVPPSSPAKAAENLRVLSQLLSDYHRAHTYLGKDIFVCGDMASDVWNMVETKGMKAKIVVGNVEKGTHSVLDANHVWVLAEISPGTWSALEVTAGGVVSASQNEKYYSGILFSNPKEFRAFSDLLSQHRVAAQKLEEAGDSYNQMVDQYNRGNWYKRSELKGELGIRAAILKQRTADVDEITKKLDELVLRNKEGAP